MTIPYRVYRLSSGGDMARRPLYTSSGVGGWANPELIGSYTSYQAAEQAARWAVGRPARLAIEWWYIPGSGDPCYPVYGFDCHKTRFFAWVEREAAFEVRQRFARGLYGACPPKPPEETEIRSGHVHGREQVFVTMDKSAQQIRAFPGNLRIIEG